MVPGAVTQRRTLVLGDHPAKGLVATSGVRESGVQRQLICLPTASGKTAVFAQLVRQGRRRGLGLAHREESVTHHVSKLHEVDPTISVRIALRRRWHGVVPRVLAGRRPSSSFAGGSLSGRDSQRIATFLPFLEARWR